MVSLHRVSKFVVLGSLFLAGVSAQAMDFPGMGEDPADVVQNPTPNKAIRPLPLPPPKKTTRPLPVPPRQPLPQPASTQQKLKVLDELTTTDKDIEQQTQLTSLELDNTPNFVGTAFQSLTNITELKLFDMKIDVPITGLQQLTRLTVGWPKQVMKLESLTQLKELELMGPKINCESLSGLTQLNLLSLENMKVSDDALKPLTNLQTLKLCTEHNINGSCFYHLTGLKTLRMLNGIIHSDPLKKLTNLTDLCFADVQKITRHSAGTIPYIQDNLISIINSLPLLTSLHCECFIETVIPGKPLEEQSESLQNTVAILQKKK